jgi:hypothetical protein
MLTGTKVEVQTADAAAVASQDLTDTSVTAPVRTLAGQQDVSLQLLEQSPVGFDEIVFADLIADYKPPPGHLGDPRGRSVRAAQGPRLRHHPRPASWDLDGEIWP